MTDILSLSDLELRKEVAMAKGYSVQPIPQDEFYGVSDAYVLVNPQGHSCDTWYSKIEPCWQDAPKYESFIGDSFPLILDMRDMGWDATINCIHNAKGEKALFVYVVNDDRIGDFIEVHSNSNTDPSDAIAKAYLLVKRECE